jgi:hypothetical protein
MRQQRSECPIEISVPNAVLRNAQLRIQMGARTHICRVSPPLAPLHTRTPFPHNAPNPAKLTSSHPPMFFFLPDPSHSTFESP